MDPVRVAGLYLVNDVSLDPVHFVGAFTLRSVDITASNLREHIAGVFPHLTPGEHSSSYAFLTSQGWEVSNDLENSITAEALVCKEAAVKVRLKRSDARLGVVFCEGSSEQAVGFVFTKTPLSGSVQDVRELIKKQLPEFYSMMAEGQGLCILDNNGWPIRLEQETVLGILHVVTNNMIKTCPTPLTKSLPVDITVSPVDILPHSSEEKTRSEPVVVNHPTRATSSHQESLKTYDMMLSYVHKEAKEDAILLCHSLEKLGYSVFLDIHNIKAGSDWQDTLNNAIVKCQLFVPLVTSLYGLTEWTNKEVKLADTLNKMIIPVNFLQKWPPLCLAIQFATTQYIHWVTDNASATDRYSNVASMIDDRYMAMKKLMQEESQQQQQEASKAKDDVKLKVADAASGSKTKKRSLSSVVRKSLLRSDSLVVICFHPKQKPFFQTIDSLLKSKGYETWASFIEPGEETKFKDVFREKINEAAVVIFLLSTEFAKDDWCEQAVYYCEGRKKLIPIITDSVDMPVWMATLIGFDTFLDTRASNFESAFMEEVECETQPSKAEAKLRKLVTRKTELHKLCTDLAYNLPEGRLVYISGGTEFYSSNGQSICYELGKLLAREGDIILVTGGSKGVGETVERSFYDERLQMGLSDGIVRVQSKDSQDRSEDEVVPYGKTLHYGNGIKQREMVIARVLDLCVLIEGGPSAAFETHQFSWSGHTVVPVQVTGGAASGRFGVPPSIFHRPIPVTEEDWGVLKDQTASPVEVAKAVVKIINAVKPKD